MGLAELMDPRSAGMYSRQLGPVETFSLLANFHLEKQRIKK